MQRIGVMQQYVSAEKRDRKADTLLAQAQSVNAKSSVARANLQRDAAQAWLDLALSTRALQTARKLLAENDRTAGGRKSQRLCG